MSTVTQWLNGTYVRVFLRTTFLKLTQVAVQKLKWSPNISVNPIEPGVLWVFKLAIGIQWTFLSVYLVFRLPELSATPDYSAIFAWFQAVILLIYLSWNKLRRNAGEFYLPIALFIAALEPVISQAVATYLNLQAGLPPSEALVNPRRLYIRLLLPMLLISVQYGYQALLSFVFGTSCLSIILAYWLDPNTSNISNTIHHAFYRMFIFTLAGVIIVLLSKVQRKQRRELAQKNAQLAHYATTLEELAISRERNRLARELHDTLAHTLSALNVQLKALEVLLDKDPQQARQLLKQTQELTRTGLQESRSALQALRTNAIEEFGLIRALQKLFERVSERYNLHTTYNLPNKLQLRPDVEQQLYRIAEEAINNIVSHAKAQNVKVSVRNEEDYFILEITDDGVGFNTKLPAPVGHYGLTGMKERALVINGKLEILSNVPQGTIVQLTVPTLTKL